jgi:hypothetical protein
MWGRTIRTASRRAPIAQDLGGSAGGRTGQDRRGGSARVYNFDVAKLAHLALGANLCG